jgi:hypothetical protein
MDASPQSFVSFSDLRSTGSTSGERKQNHMNSLIQPNRQLRYLFITLLLACFAIAQSAQAEEKPEVITKEDGPNHWLIRIGPDKPLQRPLQCATGQVKLQSAIDVTFNVTPKTTWAWPVDIKFRWFVGSAPGNTPTNPRTLRAEGLKVQNVTVPLEGNKEAGRFAIVFKVTGPALPGGKPLEFTFRQPLYYTLTPNHRKVTHIVLRDLNGSSLDPEVRCSKKP